LRIPKIASKGQDSPEAGIAADEVRGIDAVGGVCDIVGNGGGDMTYCKSD
jgi:hypothetical protein